MSKQFRLIIGLAAAGILHGQAASFKANVPFPFVAAGQLLEAGEYTFESDMIPGLLVVKAERGKESVVVKGLPITSTASPERNRLVFNRYGDQYFLSEVWPPGSASGRQVPPCNQERDLARQITPEHASVGSAR